MDEPKKEVKELVVFRSAAIRNRNLIYILSGEEELNAKGLPNTAFLMFDDGELKFVELEKWSAISVCVARQPKEQMVAIGEDGTAAVWGSGEALTERIGAGDDHPGRRGPLREVRTIGGRVYACGMDRQVYRREAANRWRCIDQGIAAAPAAEDVFGFESIHGFSEEDITAVGWHGEIWHYDGKGWERIDSPTNLILTRVFCAGDGNVYACGQRGMLLRGRGRRWQVIEHGATREEIWDLQWFEGRLYLATMRMLYTLADDRLEPVDTGEETPATCHQLDAADGILWSVGAKDILQFDGRLWTRIQ